MRAKVHPYPSTNQNAAEKQTMSGKNKVEFKLPTGAELMSAPMLNPQQGKKAKEIESLQDDINAKLAEAKEHETLVTKKVMAIMGAFAFFVIGTLMVFAGLQVTVLFKRNANDYALTTFGFLFYLPTGFAVWFVYFPSKEEAARGEEEARRAEEEATRTEAEAEGTRGTKAEAAGTREGRRF
jgi:hypothetical protein